MFSDHIFWTRNARKSIKGSKNSDSNLVSNENLTEILLSSRCVLGKVTWAKIPKTFLTYGITGKKHETQNFLYCWLKDLQSLLRVWTALQHNRRKSCAVAKTHENCLILGWFEGTIYLYVGSEHAKKNSISSPSTDMQQLHQKHT